MSDGLEDMEAVLCIGLYIMNVVACIFLSSTATADGGLDSQVTVVSVPGNITYSPSVHFWWVLKLGPARLNRIRGTSNGFAA